MGLMEGIAKTAPFANRTVVMSKANSSSSLALLRGGYLPHSCDSHPYLCATLWSPANTKAIPEQRTPSCEVLSTLSRTLWEKAGSE